MVIEAWKALVRQGDLRPVVQDLLVAHYDPVYLQSMERNFVQFAQASTLSPADRTMASMQVLAGSMLGA